MSKWSLSQTITNEQKLFACPSSVALSHRYNKLFVATYDDIECWMNNCCIQVFDIKKNGEETTYSTQPIWRVEGKFGYPCGMAEATDENGEKIIFVCDESKNRIAILSFKDGKIMRSLYGQLNEIESSEGKGDDETETPQEVENSEPVETAETSSEEIPQAENKSDEEELPTKRYSFTKIASVSVNQNGSQYTIIVSGYRTSQKIILNGLMSTEIIETELKSCGTHSTLDSLKNQQIFVGCSSNEVSILDLESEQVVFTTNEINLDRPVHVLLDNTTRTLFIVNDNCPSITILTERVE